jgi:hypothetical protein
MGITKWGRVAVAGVTLAGGLASATTAAAQTFDLRTTDAGFTPVSIAGANAWTWVSGTGWVVDGSPSVSEQRLLTPVFRADGGLATLTLRHAFDFEQKVTGGPANPVTGCADGGKVLFSIDGGAFSGVAASGGTLYSGPFIAGSDNPLAPTGNAFCGTGGGFTTSVFTGVLAPGQTIQLAFAGGWDGSLARPNPNWVLTEASFTGVRPEQVVPEPATYALLGTGLLVVGGVAARRKRTTA